MSEQEIREANKLIASFDDLIKSDPSDPKNESYYRSQGDWVYYTHLKYHFSWDWLKPVIDKCYKIPVPRHITFKPHGLFAQSITCDIDKAYKGVVDFIKWYNTQTSKP